MKLKLFKKSKRFQQQDGIALLTTILLLFLMSSLLVGFAVLLLSNQQLAGANNDQVVAFYAAEAGMEKMTADLGNLFSQTYSPSIGQVNALETTPNGPPVSSLFPNEGVTYVTADGNPGYTIVPQAVDTNGNPAPTITTIKSGTYQGMTAMATEYTLTVNARTASGREVNLVRTTQTVGIPMFQFGIFANTDLDFFPGPTFSFGGRTHTNGNLWLAGQSTLTLSDKVDAYKDILRTRLENGYLTAGTYTGTINVATQPCTQPCTPNVRALAMNEGSLQATIAPYDTPVRTTNWGTISQTDYNSNLRNGLGSAFPQYSTGASQLNLAVVTIGNGTTQTIDLIRRPAQGESSSITNERYFAQASLRVLLSDNPSDIMNENCVDQSTQPFDLSYLATPPGVGGANWLASTYVPLVTLTKKLIANGVPLIPLPASGATSAGGYTSTDGYWLPPSTGNPTVNSGANFFPIVKGFIKIEAQLAPYPVACASSNQSDVTIEVLALGYIGRNINPVTQSLDGAAINPEWYYNGTDMSSGKAPAITSLSTTALGYQNATTTPPGGGTFVASSVSTVGAPKACPDPHPNAVIRLARIRDNPSSVFYTTGKLSTTKPFNYPAQSSVGEACGVDPAAPTVLSTTRSGMSTGGVYGTYSTWLPQPYDTWPNTLFDTREGTLRDEAMSSIAAPNTRPTLNGTMHYVELDAKNLSRWFGGAIGSTGTSTKDSVVAPDNFTVYVSDRRGNYANGLTFATWPPTSYTKNETGEFGWNDLVNSGTDKNGCPDNTLETGEDIDAVNNLYTYGAASKYIHASGLGLTSGTALTYGQLGIFTGLAGTASTNAVTTNSIPCTTIPTYSNTTNSDGIWPMMVASLPNAARENPPLFFRRALKIVNGSDLTAVGTCPGSVSCGLTITSENPVYIQGDYNANAASNGWSSTEIASSVAGDAVTLLSDQWNDVNSFASPYSTSLRSGNTTWYRLAIIAGATLPFTQPTFSGVSADYGTDGGVHNFLRYIEAWGGTLEYNGSIVDLYYSRQANGTFKCCATVYGPPSRGYNFDTNFLNPTLLPPRTPLFRTVSTTGWTRVLAPQAASYK
jgi:Tfp pilus assembly protein PilX